MKSKKHIDRKTAIENVLRELRKLDTSGHEIAQCYFRLIRELEFMTHPEVKMPRFDALLNSIWIAATNEQT